MKLREIIQRIDIQFPFLLQEEWDNSGLQIGDPEADILSIMLALDPSIQAIAQAATEKCNLLITHHPLFFQPVRSLVFDNPARCKVRDLVSSGTALLALHTNVDSGHGGINDYLSALLGLENTVPLLPSHEKLFKIVVFVPPDYADDLKDALSQSGAATIGAYDKCFFSAAGEGCFRPGPGTNPFIVQQEESTVVAEVRLETICRERFLHKSLSAMIKSHPYEEPAYDFFQLSNRSEIDGIGRYGTLAAPCSAETICSKLSAGPGAILSPAPERMISRVAVCGGAADRKIVQACISKKSELLVCGEIRYHDSLELTENGIAVISLGHRSSEICFIPVISRVLSGFFQGPVINCSETAEGRCLKN
ncbi:MAG: Nif3-like dinuclear metal center hexameric protein [Candidatus Wallbacteria bacterium]|nr:Nif3-like dinuclear metal center hexameric protein [Candidatus Wallbacteria bacterium]